MFGLVSVSVTAWASVVDAVNQNAVASTVNEYGLVASISMATIYVGQRLLAYFVDRLTKRWETVNALPERFDKLEELIKHTHDLTKRELADICGRLDRAGI